MGIGLRLKNVLDAKEMKVSELARISGIAPQTIYAIIKRDNDTVKPEILNKLTKTLEIPPWELMGISAEDDEVVMGNKALEYAIASVTDKLKKESQFNDQALDNAIKKAKNEWRLSYEEAIAEKISMLNEDGKKEALKRITELSQLREYKK